MSQRRRSLPRSPGCFTRPSSLLLYGSETWCLTGTARLPLGSFQVEAARRITGKMPYKVKLGGGNEWIYPHTANVLAAADLHPLHHYIGKRWSIIYKSVRNRPIFVEVHGSEVSGGHPPLS